MALLDWADRRVIEARHNWIMQQQLSNHFLLRRLITPQWKLLLDNFRFIPPVVELRNKDFFFLFQTRHEFWKTMPLQEILRSSAEIQRMWASDGMVPRRKEHSSKTAQIGICFTLCDSILYENDDPTIMKQQNFYRLNSRHLF